MTDHEHGSCRDLLGALSAYLDGEAEEALCQEIERHMEGCENCRIVVDTLAKTVHLYRERGHTPLPDDARQRLYAALDLTDFLDNS
jgi:anti-sigma factor (TIGR02949 family)